MGPVATFLTLVVLLAASNTFMNFAWYGHLKFKTVPLVTTILISWLIALPEYALQVPANRLAHGQFTAPQLKIVQEAISISVFLGLSTFYLKEPATRYDLAAFGLVLLAIGVMYWPKLFPATVGG